MDRAGDDERVLPVPCDQPLDVRGGCDLGEDPAEEFGVEFHHHVEDFLVAVGVGQDQPGHAGGAAAEDHDFLEVGPPTNSTRATFWSWLSTMSLIRCCLLISSIWLPLIGTGTTATLSC